jgi:hypothetical protein
MAFSNLHHANFMLLTTFRKTGVGVPTPVWFAQQGDKLYVFTDAQSGKVKRIRHTPRVTVAPCNLRGDLAGDTVEGTARVLDASEFAHANAVMNQKYGFQKRIFDVIGKLRRHRARVFLEVSA